MAKRMAKVFMLWLIAGVGPGVSGPAWSEPVPTVVVHLSDPDNSMGISDRERVQAQVVDVYAKAGVRIEWDMGPAWTAAPDSRRHLELVILGVAATERRVLQHHRFGAAISAAGRAYICHGRIVAHAFRTGGNPSRALALVMVHELGHLLLPESGHTASGLMRADWSGPIRRIPEFTPSQAETLRAMASAAP